MAIFPVDQVKSNVESQAEDILSISPRICHIFDGISQLLFISFKGVHGCLHSKGGKLLSAPLALLLPFSEQIMDDVISAMSSNNRSPMPHKFQNISSSLTFVDVMIAFSTGHILTNVLRQLLRHVHPSNLAELWLRLVATVKLSLKYWMLCETVAVLSLEMLACLEISTLYVIELLIFALCHHNSRAISCDDVKDLVASLVVPLVLDLCDKCFAVNNVKKKCNVALTYFVSDTLYIRSRVLFCRLWVVFPHEPVLQRRLRFTIDSALSPANGALFPSVQKDGALILTEELFPQLSVKLISRFLVKPVIRAISSINTKTTDHSHIISDEDSSWLALLCQVFTKLADCRKYPDFQGHNFDTCPTFIDETADSSRSMANESQDYYIEGEQSSNKISQVLNSCDQELEVLTSHCLKIVIAKVDANIIKSPWADNAILALSCLVWIANVHHNPLSHSASNKNMLKDILTFCRTNIFSFFADSIKNNVHGIELLFSKYIELFCAVDALNLDNHSGEDENKSYLKHDLLRLLINVVMHSPHSILNVSRLLFLLEYILPNKNSGDFVGLSRDGYLTEKEEDALASRLSLSVSSPSYWLRFYALKVLCFLTPPTITTKAETLKTTAQRVSTGNHEANMDDEEMLMVLEQRTEVVDVFTICFEAATLPASLKSEREFSRRLGQLQTWIAASKFESKYVELICSFCLGLLHFKFMPFWEPCINLIVTAVNISGLENAVWPLLLRSIEYLSTKPLEIKGYSNVKRHHIDILNFNHILQECDNGEIMISSRVASSSVFLFNMSGVLNSERNFVYPDDRADTATVFNSVWSILRKSPVITLRHSKVVVPMFFRFLNEQYYHVFIDDPDIPILRKEGILCKEQQNSAIGSEAYPILPNDVVKKRLILFLEVFAAVSSPKQLHQHQLLWKFYVAILSKPEINVVKLAMKCIFSYKVPYLNPYKDSLLGLLTDSTFRNELLVFDVSRKGGTVLEEHRKGFIPILSRILYGRFSTSSKGSKSDKEQSIARRHAILTFLGQLPGEEMETFVHLIIRGVVPKESMLNLALLVDNVDSNWNSSFEKMLLEMPSESLVTVPLERQIGFLHVLEHAVKTCGFNFIRYVHVLCKVVSSMLVATQIESVAANEGINLDKNMSTSDANDEESEDNITAETFDKFSSTKDTPVSSTRLTHTQTCKIRTMCLQRLCDLIHQYNEHFDFFPAMESLWASLGPLLSAIPGSICGSLTAKPPALLKLIHALAKYDGTIAIVANRVDVVIIVIKCVAAFRVSQNIVSMIMEIITQLLTIDDGSVILNHSKLIISCFSRRFLGPKYDLESVGEVKLSELRISPSGCVREELQLLSLIATKYFSRETVDIDIQSVGNLSVLLLGMIRTYTTTKKVRVEESWVVSILKTYASLIWRVKDIRAHVGFVSRLFGPASHTLSLFNKSTVRQELVEVYKQLATHPSTGDLLKSSLQAIEKLVAMDSTIIDSRDFGQCMPVFQALSGNAGGSSSDFDYSWSALLGPDVCRDSRELSLCNVVIYECIRSMYDAEIVIRSAALSALKQFLYLSGLWSGLIPSECENNVMSSEFWLDHLRSVLVPGIHRGLKAGSDHVAKGFLVLQSHVTRLLGTRCLGHPEHGKVFHSDLVVLMHDDVEQDFFENIFHIQFHRRGKAMNKLRSVLLEKNSFGTHSVVHVLLPLAMHPLCCEEFKKKEHMQLLQDSTALLSAIALHLPWNLYYALIRNLLKLLDCDRCEKEKVLLSALCGVLDSFHFDMTTVNHINANTLIDEGEDDEADADGDVDAQVDKNDITTDDWTTSEVVGNNIARKVIQSIMPWVKVYLLKENTDHTGNKSKTVRTLVAVALTKLLTKLEPPVITTDKKNTLFLNLVMSIISTLKSKDSSARDAARDCLSKMVLTMGNSSMKVVLYELHHSLNSGYQRHVRNYTVRSLLSSVMKDYAPDSSAFSLPLLTSDMADLATEFAEKVTVPEFDKCIPILIEFCMDDINGIAVEDRESKDDVKRSLIREAKGNKANEILEICGRCLLFRPTYALIKFPTSAVSYNLQIPTPPTSSSVHSLVTPLLDILSTCSESITSAVIGRISEALQRIALGLSKNPSFLPSELLLYLHSTLHPYVSRIIRDISTHQEELGKLGHTVPESDELDADIPSYLKEDTSDEEDAALYSRNHKGNESVSNNRPKTWLPMESRSMQDRRAVVNQRNTENRALITVADGVSAPKLTGRHSHNNRKVRNVSSRSRIESDEAFAASVKFCLTLLLSSLKQNRMDSDNEETRGMAAPFLPLLGQCLRLSQNSDIVLLATRCICALLSWGLEVSASYSRAVGKRMLSMMYRGGAALCTDSDLVQTCIKGLTSLFRIYSKRCTLSDVTKTNVDVSSSEDMLIEVEAVTATLPKEVKEKLPLDVESIRALLSLLTSSVLEITSTYQNSAFQLVKLIVDVKVVVPEMYDLVECLAEQVVLSHRKGVRDAAGNIVIHFMLTFPLGKKRLTSHLKQFIQNCSYEYEEGRCAALKFMVDLCHKLPVPVIDDFSQLIFLPMSLQVINDSSGLCRSAASDVIVALMKRCSTDKVSTCLQYSLQWMGIIHHNSETSSQKKAKKKRHNKENDSSQVEVEIKPLIRTGVQVLGLIVSGRPDAVRKNKSIPDLVFTIRVLLHQLLGVSDEAFSGDAKCRRKSFHKRELSTSGRQEGEGDDGAVATWSILYHTLILMEKLLFFLPQDVDNAILSHQSDETLPFLMETIQESMLYPHSWVRSVSCRVLAQYLDRRDPTCLGSPSRGVAEVLEQENHLYNMSRRLCVVLNQPTLPNNFLPYLSKCLVFAIRGLFHLSSDEHENTVQLASLDCKEDSEIDSNFDEVEESNTDIKPAIRGANWVVQRLRGIGADSRGHRRLHVIKIFTDLIRIEEEESLMSSHLHQLIEVCVRSRLSRADQTASEDVEQSSANMKILKDTKEAAGELLEVIEKRFGSSTFIGIYGEVQRRVESSKAAKKRKLAAEAVSDPVSYAQRKAKHAEKKKESRKRKNERFAVMKGLKKKKPKTNGAILFEE